MSDTLERETLTETELQQMRDAAQRGTVRAIDARSDGARDCDALQDGARIGERIADGFAFMRGEW